MSTTRSQLIFGRVYRELYRIGFNFDYFQTEQIYDEMHMAQEEIIAFVGLEKWVEIYLANGLAEYEISVNDKEVINRIITMITPEEWEYQLEYISKEKWDEVLKSELDTEQPCKYSIFENKIVFYPTPDSTYESALIKIYADLKASINKLSSTIDPDLPSIYDKEIEWLTLFFITNDVSYYQKYLESVDRKRNLSSVNTNGIITKDADW